MFLMPDEGVLGMEGSLFFKSDFICGLIAWGILVPAFEQDLTPPVLRQKTLPATSRLRKAKSH